METFAGIGAQHKAITNIKEETTYKFEVIKTSEWDSRAIIAYSLIHHDYNIEQVLKENNLDTEQKIDKWILGKTFSLDSKKPSNLTRKPYHFKKRLVAASIKNNNSPDINKVKGSEIKDIDLLTYSFPCQGLSIANMGRDKGIKRDVDSTSNLVWQIGRILGEAKDNKQKLPRYLLMENVSALLSKKHRADYDEWVRLLKEDLGYETFTYKLKANEFGMVQTRMRVFAISILKPNKKWTTEKIGKILDSYKYILSKDESIKQIKSILKTHSTNKKIIEEFEHSTPNNTPSRVRMKTQNKDLSSKDITKLNTLTTKQDRHPNIGMLPYKSKSSNKLDYRFITPREAYQIMGFESKDFDKVRTEWIDNNIITKESLYRQAGNSIAVKVLEVVFKTIDQIEKRENEN
ncbi:MAG: DNA cytosine methyltransferase [Mycoplasma sp.]|nr:DNA cytosine methyltransferase [Mycoplasma sp.]